MKLKPADKLEVTVLVDNYCDFFLPDTDIVKRLRNSPPNAPMAEPGLSYLIKVHSDTDTHTLLFDTGISGTCLLNNVKVFSASKAVQTGDVTSRFEEIEAIILSHGHFDHCGGVLTVLKGRKKGLPVYLHAGAFVERRAKITPEMGIDLPAMDENAVVQAGAELKKIESATLIASDLILLSGNVTRQTDFEKGMPGAEAKIDDHWITDPFHDDQCIAIHIKNQGLVLIGGCSHAGIINTVRHVQEVSGIQDIHAVMGGFHLGGENEKLIDPTINEMMKIDPDVIIPMHCTGWNAIKQFSQKMPDSFIVNSVGSTYIFAS